MSDPHGKGWRYTPAEFYGIRTGGREVSMAEVALMLFVVAMLVLKAAAFVALVFVAVRLALEHRLCRSESGGYVGSGRLSHKRGITTAAARKSAGCTSPRVDASASWAKPGDVLALSFASPSRIVRHRDAHYCVRAVT